MSSLFRSVLSRTARGRTDDNSGKASSSQNSKAQPFSRRLLFAARKGCEDSFSYRPLDEDAHEIRVLRVVKSGRQADPISCTIRHISLDTNPVPEYETISYAWGDPTPCTLITLDGHPFLVPSNTELAMRRVATTAQPRIIWIDAVCINQKDIEERTHQVALMGKVFSFCKRVLVYLGESDETTHRAFENLRQLHHEIGEELGGQRTFEQMMYREDGTWATADNPLRSPIDEEALVTFFSRPWFRYAFPRQPLTRPSHELSNCRSRVWVVQELVLAPEAICLCGEFEVRIHDILECAAFLRIYHSNHTLEGITASSPHTMWFIAHGYSRRVSIDMAPLLVHGRKYQASDMRDKVFGVLGLHHPERFNDMHYMITPDYHKSTQEVFRDAVRYCIVTDEWGLHLLNFVSHRSEEDLRTTRPPSWVPRLDRERDIKLESHPIQVRAAGIVAKVDITLAMSTADGNLLRLRGYRLDTLEQTSTTFQWDLFLRGHENGLLAWLDAAANLASMVEGGIQMLSRLLTMDTNRFNQRNSLTQYQEGLLAIQTYLRVHGHPDMLRDLPQDASDFLRQASHYWDPMELAVHGRKVCKTAGGFLGLAPRLSLLEDIVVWLDGNDFPSILRPKGDYYQFLGNCYIDNAMYWQEGYPGLKEKLDAGPKEIFDLR